MERQRIKKANKAEVLELSLKGNEIVKPRDIVKDPYVFEFLGIPENKPMMESDLEEALVRQIEKFLLELGKGFLFEQRQRDLHLMTILLLIWFYYN